MKSKWILIVSLIFLCIVVFLALLPFYKFPPWHRDDKRNLRLIHAIAPRHADKHDGYIHKLSGPVMHNGVVLQSRTSECPFFWFTTPASGDQITLLRSSSQRDAANLPPGFVEQFYVAARDTDGYNGRWVLLNTGEPRYVKESQIDWKSQTLHD